MSWLSQQAADVEAETEAQAAAAAAAADEDSKAHSVGLGLHIRGRTAMYEGLTDEDDPARFAYHNELSMAARGGEPGDAERVVDQMAAEGYVPGPRAYHALVLSHVRARDAEGALGAIRRCWDAGVTPLPETYAAVVAAHVAAGDLETAEAVFASNRRAGVDCAKSWQQLVAALLQAGQDEQAMALVKQGMSEGMELEEGVCSALLRILCARQELQLAADVVAIIKASEMRLGLDQLEPLVDAHLQRGEPEAAFAYLQEVGERGPAATDAFYRVFEALLASSASLAEVQAQVQRFQGQAVAVRPGVRLIVAQMAALLRLHEAQAAMQSFRAFQSCSLNRGGLALLEDELLGGLLLELSRADLPSELYEVMAVMCRAGRPLPPLALQPDADGCTVLGAWVRRRLGALEALQQPEHDGEAVAADEAAALLPGLSLGGGAPAPTLDIDGVAVDPLQLCAVDGGGAPLAVSRMTVRELRAELAARRAPVAGNKKELVKRVQKLRQLDGTRSATTGPMLRSRSDKKAGSGAGKVEKVLTGFRYVKGLEAGSAEQRVVEEALEAEEEGEAPEWDAAEEEEGASARRRGEGEGDGEGEEDEGSLFDDDDAAAWVDAQLPPDNFVLSTSSPFSSALAGPHEAAAMLLGAVHNMHAQPSVADVEAVGAYVLGAADVPAAVLLAGALHRLPQPLPGSEELRAQLLAVCEEAGVDAEAALTAVLGEREGEAAEVARVDDAQREIASLFAEIGL